MIMLRFCFIVVSLLFVSNANAAINIVAAENFYGEVAKEIGGAYVNVNSILSNPNQDPHLFTISPSTAALLSKANVIIYNGADYDPWIETLLSDKKDKHILIVADLLHVKNGSNPHIWYMPETMPTVAVQLAGTLSQLDPAHRADYQKNLAQFIQSCEIVFLNIKNLKQQFHNVPVIATEPVFNDMAEAIGLDIHGKKFQWSIMNDVPPTITEVKQFEDDLRQHAVRVFIFNNQVINPTTKRMLSIAQDEKIPVVGVSETLPANLTYVQWMLQELTSLGDALKSEQHHE